MGATEREGDGEYSHPKCVNTSCCYSTALISHCSPDYLNRVDPISESDSLAGGGKLNVGYGMRLIENQSEFQLDRLAALALLSSFSIGSHPRLFRLAAQSKWIAELIVLEARNRGVPVTIFRPGYVTGDSKTGVMNTDDYLVRLLKGCIQLGKVGLWMVFCGR